MTSKYYSRFVAVAILLSLLLAATMPVSANTIYMPLVSAEYVADSSVGDGTCLFWRSGNDVYLSIYTYGTYLYVVTSSEREDEPYTYQHYPRVVQVGEVDANGESFAAYTYDSSLNKFVRCQAQFLFNG